MICLKSLNDFQKQHASSIEYLDLTFEQLAQVKIVTACYFDFTLFYLDASYLFSHYLFNSFLLLNY